jgi:MFS family permease
VGPRREAGRRVYRHGRAAFADDGNRRRPDMMHGRAGASSSARGVRMTRERRAKPSGPGGAASRGRAEFGVPRKPWDRPRTRAVVASTVGTAIEWYDFFLYGSAAALVFPQQFFPQSDAVTGALLSFSTYFVGFAARPLGAVWFGHYGDRIGRKASLVATLLLMGFSTMAIGLVPDYGRIGIWGAVLLTAGRAVQGIAVGGEWGGSVLLAAEWARDEERGLLASWPQFGAPAGLLLANGATLAMTYVAGPAFLSWGWRVPFLFSGALVALGLYIRLGILETPVFARLQAENRVARAPVREVLRRCGREVALSALLRSGQQAPSFIFVTYILTYATATLGFSRSAVLKGVTVQAFLSLFTVPLFGHLSDRIGRRRMIAIGCAVMVFWSFAYFRMLESGSALLAFTAIVLAVPLHDMQYGPQAALIAESFPARLRYSGSSLGYQLASLTSGGPAPLVAVWLRTQFQSSLAIAFYLAAMALLSLLALGWLPERPRSGFQAE